MEEKANLKDNTLTQISFDFNKPVNVTIYYEDSDEETSQLDTKQEITYKDHRNEDNCRIKDTKQTCNDLNINSAFDSSNIKVNTENRSCNEKEFVNALKEFVDNIQTNNEVNSNCHKKRRQKISPPKDMPNLAKICKQVTNQNNDHPEMTNINNPQTVADNVYVMNLLNSVSTHLITIHQAFDYHNQIQNSKLVSQNTIDSSMTYFLRLKYHYFNLSLCAVATVILPQLFNKNFVKQFLDDTIKIANKMNKSVSYQEIVSILKDLITWTKQKQLTQIPLQFDVAKAQQLCNNKDNLLKAHLNCKQRPLSKANTSAEINSNNYLYSAQMSAEQIQPSNHTDYLSNTRPTFVQYPPSNLAYRSNGDYLPNPNFEQINSSNFTYRPTSNHSTNSIVTALQLPPYNTLASIPTMKKHNTNARISAVQMLPDNCTSNPVNNHFTDTTITAAKMQPKNFTSIPQKRKNFLDPSESTGPDKSCLYAAGPAWRRMSINVDTALLNEHNKQVGPSLNNALNLPDQDSSNVIGSYMKQFSQPQSSVDPKRPTFPQQTPTNYQNYNISQNDLAHTGYHTKAGTSSPHQAPLSLPNQLPIPTPQTNNKQMVQQIEIEPIEQNQIETTRSLSTDSGFMSPLHFNTAADPTCTCNDGKNRETIYSGWGQVKRQEILLGACTPRYAAESKHPLPQMATFQIAIGQEEYKNFQIPQITHVTSLNPSAAYITDGKCYVCEKVTKKKCIGCLKFYYCSYECQRADWYVHMGLCGNT